MCIGSDAQNPLCDDCFALINNHPDPQLEDLCEECQKAAKHYCFCCGTGGHDELIEPDGICNECMKLEGLHFATLGGDEDYDEGYDKDEG